MRLFLCLSLICLLLSACAKGYKDKEGKPLSAEDLQLAQKATGLLKKAEELAENASPIPGNSWNQFIENVKLFENSCQRTGCNSLEARNDFNHLRYHAVQLDSVITEQAFPDIYPAWKSIRTEMIDPIGKELGYRISDTK